VITALEGGAASLVLASGMAAATTVFHALPLGAHVVAPRIMYHSSGGGLPAMPQPATSPPTLST